jgi:hypothetical protein
MLKQMSPEQAFLEYNDPFSDKEELRQNIVHSIKRELKGKVMFSYKIWEDTNGRKVTGVDAFRVHLLGRNNSYVLDELSLVDALTIFSDINK